MNKADTCRREVVPALLAAGWDDEPHSIAEQRTITDGRIVPAGHGFVRKPPKRVDYLLRYTRDFPLAVVEAKASYRRAADGPLEMRLKRRRGQPKLCVLDLGPRASWLEEVVPLDPDALAKVPHLNDLAGHLAESALGAFLAGLPQLDIAHFPERPREPEVDFVLTIGERRIPLEVKYRRSIDPHRDTVGLRAFLEKTHDNAPFGVLVSMTENTKVFDPRILPVSLRSLLWAR